MKVIKHKDEWYLQSETGYKKIILTTDQDLIKDGVQAIDDDFLEWFIKNPSCEFVEVVDEPFESGNIYQNDWFDYYKIIIPKTTQQIIDEDFAGGLDMGQIIPKEERSYSEEELKSAFKIGFNIGYGSPVQELDLKNEHCEKWFEQFKKK